MKDLTRRQREVLEVIADSIRDKGYPPSMREITNHLKLSSAAGIHKHIKALVRKGYLSKEDYLSRSLRVTRPSEAVGQEAGANALSRPVQVLEVPLAGWVSAGKPIEGIEQAGETLSVPASLLGTGTGHYFALRVRGDSMVEDSILDGDYVLVEARQTARSGEVVVALLRGEEVTLKRFLPEGAKVRLQPANATMAPLIVPAEQVSVQGVVVGIWRVFQGAPMAPFTR